MERTFGIKAFPSNRFSISQLTPRRRQTGAPIPRPSRAKIASQLSPRVPAVRQQCLISRCRIRSPKKLRNGLPRHFHVPPKDCQLQKETKWSHCAFELLASRQGPTCASSLRPLPWKPRPSGGQRRAFLGDSKMVLSCWFLLKPTPKGYPQKGLARERAPTD